MHDTVDYIIVGTVYLFMGIWCGHVGRLLHHSKPLRLLEIVFWPAFGVGLVLWGLYTSIVSIFQDEVKL
jgi:hypothetical protein